MHDGYIPRFLLASDARFHPSNFISITLVIKSRALYSTLHFVLCTFENVTGKKKKIKNLFNNSFSLRKTYEKSNRNLYAAAFAFSQIQTIGAGYRRFRKMFLANDSLKHAVQLQVQVQVRR